jgi:hypothetical protein
MTTTPTMRERLARALLEHSIPCADEVWGHWERAGRPSEHVAAEAIEAVDALLAVLAEPTEAAKRRAEEIGREACDLENYPVEEGFRAMIAAIQEGA